MIENNCTTCRFSHIDMENGPRSGKRLCRLNPPIPFAVSVHIVEHMVETFEIMALWPAVTIDDFCHQHLPTGKLQ